jgi:hypothetical protein
VIRWPRIKKPSSENDKDGFFKSGVYFFLWVAQNLDFATAAFLHCFPSLVFAPHLTFFTFAIVPPFSDIIAHYFFHSNEKKLTHERVKLIKRPRLAKRKLIDIMGHKYFFVGE